MTIYGDLALKIEVEEETPALDLIKYQRSIPTIKSNLNGIPIIRIDPGISDSDNIIECHTTKGVSYIRLY